MFPMYPGLASWAKFSRPFGTGPETPSWLVSFQQVLSKSTHEKANLDKSVSSAVPSGPAARRDRLIPKSRFSHMPFSPYILETAAPQASRAAPGPNLRSGPLPLPGPLKAAGATPGSAKGPFDRGAMFDQAMGAPQAGGAHNQLQPRSDGKGLIASTAHLEGEHPPNRASAGWQSRGPDRWAALDNAPPRLRGGWTDIPRPAGHFRSAGACGAPALQAPQDQPAVERGKVGTPTRWNSLIRVANSDLSPEDNAPPRASQCPDRYLVRA